MISTIPRSRSRSRSLTRCLEQCSGLHPINACIHDLWWIHNCNTAESDSTNDDEAKNTVLDVGRHGILMYGLVADWNCVDEDLMTDAKFRLQEKQMAVDHLRAAHPTDRDHRCVFNELVHEYLIDSKHPVPWSVSYVCHLCSHGFDADRVLLECYSPDWAVRKNYIDEKGNPLNQSDIKQLWNQNGLCQSRRGTLMHWHIECLLNGYSIEKPHSPELRMFVEFRREFMDYLNLRPWRTEMNMFHCGLRLAGQADCVCVDSAGKLVIFDWKRCKKMDMYGFNGLMQKAPLQDVPDSNFWIYSMQLNLYRFILESEYLYNGERISVSGMYLVVLHPDQYPPGPHVYQVRPMDDEVRRLIQYMAHQFSVSTESFPGANSVFDVSVCRDRIRSHQG